MKDAKLWYVAALLFLVCALVSAGNDNKAVPLLLLAASLLSFSVPGYNRRRGR